MLVFSGVTKTFPRERVSALSDLDLEVRPGEILGLIGLNGAGKTTAIRIAVGLSLPTRGTVHADDLDIVRDKAEASLLLGWVSENPQFEASAKPLSLLRYFGGFHGLTASESEVKGLRLLREVGLNPRGLGSLRSFSQGMRKRFALAAAQIGNPRYLLLDEILNGLDPEGVHMVRQLVQDLRQRGIGILLSTHILPEIERLADRVAIIHQGRLLKVLEAKAFQQLGNTEIRLTIANLDDEALQFLRTLGPVHFEDGGLIVLESDADPGEVNLALVQRGCRVTSLSRESPDLERFFLRLVSSRQETPPAPAAMDEGETDRVAQGGTR